MTTATLGLWSDVACSPTLKGFCSYAIQISNLNPTAPPSFKPTSIGCPSNFNLIHGSCYRLLTTPYNWINAELQCEAQSAQLASFSSLSEYQAVINYYRGSGGNKVSIWIGLTDISQENTFVWVDGSTPTFTNWRTGEPSNSWMVEHCGHIWDTETYWNDAPCSISSYYSLCKLSSSPISIQQSKLHYTIFLWCVS